VVRENTKGQTIHFYVPIPVESLPGRGQLDQALQEIKAKS